jgi:hypothetical protein
MFEQMTTIQWVVIGLTALLAVSETLPFTQKIKSNGIFQGLVSLVKMIIGKKEV